MVANRQSTFEVSVCGIKGLRCCDPGDVTHVLSILDPGAPLPEELNKFRTQPIAELRFHDIVETEPGATPPGAQHVSHLLAFGRDAMLESASTRLLVHCHAGVSRSTAAGILLLMQARPMRSAHDAFGVIVHTQPDAWPNLRLLELGDTALGRHGEIVAAAGAHYHRLLKANPKLADFMSTHGRSREVTLANQWG